MKTASNAPSNLFTFKSAAACLLLLSGLTPSQATESPNKSDLHCLSETQYFPGGSLLFFDASYQEQIVLSRDENISPGVKSNAPVIVYDALGAGRVEAALDSWVDLRGFTHNINVLKRQVLFNGWLFKIPAGTPGRPSPLLVTGILDRATLWASYNRMLYHLNYAKSHLQELCAAASDPCKSPPWPNSEVELISDELEPAQQSLANYWAELEDIDLTPPTPYGGSCDNTDSINLDFDAIPPSEPWDSLYESRQSRITFSSGPSPEMDVTESVNLQTLGHEELSRLDSLEKDAQRRTQHLADLSGDPY